MPLAEYKKTKNENELLTNLLKTALKIGGPGSGHFGHAGRPGLVGGSAPSKLSSRLNEIEKNISNHSTEHTYVFDKRGNSLIENRIGDEFSVGFSKEEVAKFNGAILTHNHPDNSPISLGDIVFLQEHNLQELRAVTKDYIYSISSNDKMVKADLGKLRQDHSDFRIGILDNFIDKIDSGNMSKQEANIELKHFVIEKICDRYKINYGREGRI